MIYVHLLKILIYLLILFFICRYFKRQRHKIDEKYVENAHVINSDNIAAEKNTDDADKHLGENEPKEHQHTDWFSEDILLKHANSSRYSFYESEPPTDEIGGEEAISPDFTDEKETEPDPDKEYWDGVADGDMDRIHGMGFDPNPRRTVPYYYGYCDGYGEVK